LDSDDYLLDIDLASMRIEMVSDDTLYQFKQDSDYYCMTGNHIVDDRVKIAFAAALNINSMWAKAYPRIHLLNAYNLVKTEVYVNHMEDYLLNNLLINNGGIKDIVQLDTIYHYSPPRMSSKRLYSIEESNRIIDQCNIVSTILESNIMNHRSDYELFILIIRNRIERWCKMLGII
jgi:hypothetical protein